MRNSASSFHWLSSSIFNVRLFVPHPWHLLSSPLYDVSAHTNHIFSSIWVSHSCTKSSFYDFLLRLSVCQWVHLFFIDVAVFLWFFVGSVCLRVSTSFLYWFCNLFLCFYDFFVETFCLRVSTSFQYYWFCNLLLFFMIFCWVHFFFIDFVISCYDFCWDCLSASEYIFSLLLLLFFYDFLLSTFFLYWFCNLLLWFLLGLSVCQWVHLFPEKLHFPVRFTSDQSKISRRHLSFLKIYIYKANLFIKLPEWHFSFQH